LEEAAEWIVESYRHARKRIAGYGHRLHIADPRTTRLFELAEELGLTGKYIKIAKAVESAMKDAYGKELPINADGAIAAVLCEMDFPPILADAFFMMARVPGLVAHVVEERTRYKPMRRVHRHDIEYDGPAERELKKD
jgi:citrate synthase